MVHGDCITPVPYQSRRLAGSSCRIIPDLPEHQMLCEDRISLIYPLVVWKHEEASPP